HRLSDQGEETILLVEDEEAVRDLATEALRERGYEVLPAASAEKALEVALEAGDRIDLLLSDVILPGMNGPALAERLKADWPGLRVLFVSGYAEDTMARQGILEVGSRLVAKPFAPSLLARRVRERLDTSTAEEGIL
ncbi:MAG: response regulator, partial [Planctomycetota bacterium]